MYTLLMKKIAKRTTRHPKRYWHVRESDGSHLCVVTARTRSEARAVAKEKLAERVLPRYLEVAKGEPVRATA